MGSSDRPHDPRITVIQQELFDERRSKADKYRDLVIGRPGWGSLVAFELVMLVASWVPGALGLFLRARLYPLVLGRVGRNVVFGANVTLRHPHKIAIGDNVVIDDLCCLDAKGGDNRGIVIGNGVFVGRNTILSCKNGDIQLDDRANLGFNCEIFSASTVRVGADVLMAAYTYLVGGDHLYDRTDIPVLQQGRTARGIDVGPGAWLGAHVVVTDGSTVGRDAIIGAGAVVVGAIPEFAIAVGTPAKVIRDRRVEGAAVSPQPPAPSPQPLVMCGIAGIVDRDLRAPVPASHLAGMVAALAHRGPDGEGAVHLPGVALGMRRLAIIDVATGQQPIANETGTVHIVANGEIYNYLELQQELRALGHSFRSLASDIEVLVHGYEEWGEALPTKIRGMVAFAIWDARTQTLFAARDRAGEKPLYWTLTDRGLCFASEVKALLTRPEVGRTLDLEALDQFLTYEYVLTPRTMLRGVQALPAGSSLRYRDGAVTICRYWDPAAVAVLPWSDAEAADALREALTRAVRSQLMSEVPLGAFLSGGIDSSSIVALMSMVSDHPVKTFTMGFEDGSYNEMPFAHEVATLFGTEHTERLVTPDLGDLFDRLVPHLDSPFADVSLFPTYLVSQVARAHVTVALSGDGGDELFGGYDAYEAHALAARFAGVGAPLVPALAAVGAALPPSGRKKGLVNKFKRFIGGVATAPADLEHYRWMVHMSARARRRLYAPAFAAALDGSDVYAPVREVLARGSRDDVLNRQLFTDLTIYLADDILVKVDRMSMATSLETRAPFLDVDVMELAFSMPGSFKVRDGVRKHVLKQAMRGIVPERILHRTKEGFSIPIKNWLRCELEPLMRDLLAPARLARRGLVEPAEVARLIDAHVAGRENHAHTLFPLMVFERWADVHLA